MNHYYRFFIQALKQRKVSYGAHVDQMLKGTPYGMGITRDSKLGLHWGMASTTKRLKRKFSLEAPRLTNSDSSYSNSNTFEQRKPNEQTLREFYRAGDGQT